MTYYVAQLEVHLCVHAFVVCVCVMHCCCAYLCVRRAFVCVCVVCVQVQLINLTTCVQACSQHYEYTFTNHSQLQ